MQAYLATAQALLAEGADGPAVKSSIMQAYPNRGGEGFVDFSLYFLFPQPH